MLSVETEDKYTLCSVIFSILYKLQSTEHIYLLLVFYSFHPTFFLRIHWNTCRSHPQTKRWTLDAKLYTYSSWSVFKWTGFKRPRIGIFRCRSSTSEVLKSDGWEAPACFLTRQAPGSQQWYDGYTVTGNVIILLLRLISSRQPGYLPSQIISPIHLPPEKFIVMRICCTAKNNVCEGVYMCQLSACYFRMHKHLDVARIP